MKLTPVIPLDDVNDPVGTIRKTAEFATWLTELPPDAPLVLCVVYTPWDTTPRSWTYALNTEPAAGSSEMGHRLVVMLTDDFDDELLDHAELDVLPPLDEEPNWLEGVAAAVLLIPDMIARLQVKVLEEGFIADGWDVEEFLDESGPMMSELQQRAFMQGRWHMITIRRLIERYGDEMTDQERNRFEFVAAEYSRAFNQVMEEKRQRIETSIEATLQRILAEGDIK